MPGRRLVIPWDQGARWSRYLEAADFGIGTFELLTLLLALVGQRVDSLLKAMVACQDEWTGYLARRRTHLGTV